MIELKDVRENPTNNNHSADRFEITMVVIAFCNSVMGLTEPETNAHDHSLVTINSAIFMPPESRRALPAMICLVEGENQPVVSSGSAFPVPASSPLDELVAPYELRAGSFLSNGSCRLWGIEQRGKSAIPRCGSAWPYVRITDFLSSQRQGTLRCCAT